MSKPTAEIHLLGRGNDPKHQNMKRLVIHPEAHFEQFDDLTLTRMACNATEFAHESLAQTDPDDDTVWNAHVSMTNACSAMTLLSLRLGGRGLSDRGWSELFLAAEERAQ